MSGLSFTPPGSSMAPTIYSIFFSLAMSAPVPSVHITIIEHIMPIMVLVPTAAHNIPLRLRMTCIYTSTTVSIAENPRKSSPPLAMTRLMVRFAPPSSPISVTVLSTDRSRLLTEDRMTTAPAATANQNTDSANLTIPLVPRLPIYKHASSKGIEIAITVYLFNINCLEHSARTNSSKPILTAVLAP